MTVWEAVEDLYRTGLQPAMTLVVRRHGKIVLKRSIGCISGNVPGDEGRIIKMTPDTPISLFSASKAISALLVHKLVEQGKVRLEDHVVRLFLGADQVDALRHLRLEPRGDQRRRDHEDDQQHQHHVRHGRDVDVRADLRAPATC